MFTTTAPAFTRPYRRRITNVLVSVAMLTTLLSSPTPALAAEGASSFLDVDTTTYVFATEVAWLADQGITRGCNPPQNDKFCPDDPVTRGQMAAFLNRALDLDAGAKTFADTAGHTFEADIAALADAGITKGCNPPQNDKFCPDEPVTRGQMAAFLYRSLGTDAATPDDGGDEQLDQDDEQPDDDTDNLDDDTDNLDDDTDDGAGDTDDGADEETPEPAPALEITTAAAAAGQVAEHYTTIFEAEGGVPPYVWEATGLPGGLTLDPASGEISGMATEAGSFPIEVTVTDSQDDPYVDTAFFTLNVSPAPGCEDNTDIPDLECAALMAFAAATDGPTDGWAGELPCNWEGITCEDGHVTIIQLEGEGMAGTLVPELAWLTELTSLELSLNNLTGSIPAELGQLENLKLLILDGNSLSGEIPSELGNMASAVVVNLMSNNLNGEIPATLGGLENLETLLLSHNQLSGPIPASLGQLPKLLYFSASNNQLTGSIPDFTEPALATALFHNNELSGPLPASLWELPSLTLVTLNGNGCFTIAAPVTPDIPADYDPGWDDGCPLEITTTALPNAQAGGAYAATLTRSGGKALFTWIVTGLPTGLTYDANTGTIGGTPDIGTEGAHTVEVTLRDSEGTEVSRNYTLGVELALQSITAFGAHTCGVSLNGSAHCWGYGGNGRLGNGGDANHSTAQAVSGDLNFDVLSVGGSFTCGLSGGDAYCWGNGADGKLGNGSLDDQDTPQLVSGGHTFEQISAGTSHACAITDGGDAYCWGRGDFGKLGDGSENHNTVPGLVSGGHTFEQISAGNMHTCGVTTDGDAYCWGLGEWGRLGTGDTMNSGTPRLVVDGLTFASISAGDNHTCGVTTDGDAYCWGYGAVGQLGIGQTTYRANPQAVSGGHTFEQISAGETHTCGVTTDGAAYCWGNGADGRLGTNTGNRNTPHPVVGGLTFTEVHAGTSSTCGLTVDGSGYCWGNGAEGRLGNGGTQSHSTPQRLAVPN